MADRPTLNDVAVKAGVTITTVSRVLSGKSGKLRVSDAKAKEILRIAEELNYAPNLNARALAGQSSRVIGILVDSEAPPTVFRTLAALEREAEKNQYRTMIGEVHNSPKSMMNNLRIFSQYGVDGLIVLSSDYPEFKEELASLFKPSPEIVFAGKPSVDGINYVETDRSAGFFDAYKHLVKCGRKRIFAAIPDCDHNSIRQRSDGFEAARERYKEIAEGFIHLVRLEAHSAYRAVARDFVKNTLIPGKADAVMATTDLFAAALMAAICEAGLRVPENIALVGHDNESFCECISPSLSSIDECGETVAVHLVRMLLASLATKRNGKAPDQSFVSVRTRFIARESI